MDWNVANPYLGRRTASLANSMSPHTVCAPTMNRPSSRASTTSDSASVATSDCNSSSQYATSSPSPVPNSPTPEQPTRRIEMENVGGSNPILLPIPMPYSDCLPMDHTLPIMLRQVAGTSDLQSVEELKLRVIVRDMSLQRLCIYMPNLRELTLDGSCMPSLRDLGCGLTSLHILRVARCGLESLDGSFGFSCLQELHAAYNSIEDVGPCASLSHIRVLDFRKNNVEKIGYLSFLSICPKLEEIILSECPAAKQPGYRRCVKKLLPHLKFLDGLPLDDFEEDDEDDDCARDDDSASDWSQDDDLEGSSEYEPADSYAQNYAEGNLGTGQSLSTTSHAEATKSPGKKTSSEVEGSSNIKRPASACPSAARRRRAATARPASRRKERPLARRAVTAQPRFISNPGEEGSFPARKSDSPSILTSGVVVCGNLTAALRSRKRNHKDSQENPGSDAPKLDKTGDDEESNIESQQSLTINCWQQEMVQEHRKGAFSKKCENYEGTLLVRELPFVRKQGWVSSEGDIGEDILGGEDHEWIDNLRYGDHSPENSSHDITSPRWPLEDGISRTCSPIQETGKEIEEHNRKDSENKVPVAENEKPEVVSSIPMDRKLDHGDFQELQMGALDLNTRVQADEGEDLLEASKKWRREYHEFRDRNRARWESEKSEDNENDGDTNEKDTNISSHVVSRTRKRSPYTCTDLEI